MTIEQYTADYEREVALFNRRLREAGVEFQFPENATPAWLPRLNNRHIYQEYFVATEDGRVVYGGYILKHQNFLLGEEIAPIGDYQLPLSEGIISEQYKLIGLQLLYHALNRQPMLYALGMGGIGRPLPLFLKRMKWDLCEIPFYFRILKPFRFLRNIRTLRTSFFRTALLNIAAFTGIGWAALTLLAALRSSQPDRSPGDRYDAVESFGPWADELWNAGKQTCRLAAVRDSLTLNILYPQEDKRFFRLRVYDGDRTIGWAIVLATSMENHKQFGRMRLGTIVDCFALPNSESAVISAATEFLQAKNVDLIVSNQSHASWCAGLERTAFRQGPSNFIFAVSPKLSKKLGPLRDVISELHLNRGDGDGPINL